MVRNKNTSSTSPTAHPFTVASAVVNRGAAYQLNSKFSKAVACIGSKEDLRNPAAVMSLRSSLSSSELSDLALSCLQKADDVTGYNGQGHSAYSGESHSNGLIEIPTSTANGTTKHQLNSYTSTVTAMSKRKPDNIFDGLNLAGFKVNGAVVPKKELSNDNQMTVKKEKKSPCKLHIVPDHCKHSMKNKKYKPPMDGHISRMKAQANMYRKMFGVFKPSEELLARWSDGLYYLGVILNVDDYTHKCFMRFEDESSFWVHFKDLHHVSSTTTTENEDPGVGDNEHEDKEDSDVTCFLCRDGVSDPPNEIVICDKCGQGYHQLCHMPHIDTSILKDEEVPWQCRTCVFAACVRRGGAIKHGIGDTMHQMKQVLPYDINSLTWMKNNKLNTEEIYCYCGGPGDWYLKMLQCARCNQWFHEACIQCLEAPILYGDRFFLFVCAVCNNGKEYVKRLPLKWVDICHLILYNITIAKKIKYYDITDFIIPFFNKNFDALRLGELAKEVSTRSLLKQKIMETLQSNKSRFQCGSECKKTKVVWGLRNRSPPIPFTIFLPHGIEINDESLSTVDIKHGSASLSDSPTPLKKQGPCQVANNTSPTLPYLSNGRSPVKDLVKSGLFNMKSSIEASQNELYQSDNMPPPKRKRGRPKKRSFDSTTMSRKRSSSISSLTSSSSLSKQSFAESRKRKRKLSDVSRDSVGSGRGSDAGLSKLWALNSAVFNDETSSCSSGSLERRDDCSTLRETIARYFGAEGRVKCGERFRVCGKRVTQANDGTERHEYLIEWEGYTAGDLENLRKT